ncbi:CHC2 zinc finger domain-containing protein [Candidatus Vidania fulgoroideorum]
MKKRQWTICPYHKEKNKSMLINNDKNFFYCFGCKKYGKIKKRKSIKKMKLSYCIKKLIKYLNLNLISSIKASKYLIKRKIFFYNIIKKYKIGFYNTCINNKLGYKINDFLFKNNIFFYKKIYYFYFDKIIFPIRDLKGKYKAFIMRNLKSDSFKYIFKEIKNFKKKKILYGYYENLNHINKEKTLFIVEGVFDLMRLNNIGFYNVLSILGSDISYYQIIFLISLKKKIYFIFDPDKAGKKAYDNLINKYLSLIIKKNIYFIFIKEKDPDLYFLNKSKSFLLKKLNDSIHVSNYIYINKKKYFKKNNIKNMYLKNFFFLFKYIKKKEYLYFFNINKRNYINYYYNKNLKRFLSNYIFLKKKINISSEIKNFKFFKKNYKKNDAFLFLEKSIIKYKMKIKFILKNKFFFKNYKKKYNKNSLKLIYFLKKKIILKNEKL